MNSMAIVDQLSVSCTSPIAVDSVDHDMVRRAYHPQGMNIVVTILPKLVFTLW